MLAQEILYILDMCVRKTDSLYLSVLLIRKIKEWILSEAQFCCLINNPDHYNYDKNEVKSTSFNFNNRSSII